MPGRDVRSILHNAIIRRRRRKGVVILAYHRVCGLTGLFYDRNVSAAPEEFSRQMEYVKANFNVISGKELAACYSGCAGISENALMITFDDGFKDTIENAFPVLKEMKIPAVVFAVSDFINGRYVPWEDECAYLINKTELDKIARIMPRMFAKDGDENNKDGIIFRFCRNLRGAGKRERENILDKLYGCLGLKRADAQNEIMKAGKGMMDKEDLLKWVSAGLEVGGHTCSHPQLSKIDGAMAEKELRVSKSILEQITGKETAFFAYPYGMKGYYGRNAIRLAQKAGYKCALNMKGGMNTQGTSRFDLNRMPVGRNLDFHNLCRSVI